MSVSEVDLLDPQVEQARLLIERHLDLYTQLADDCPEHLREAVRYSLLGGGKRLRPLLTLAAAKLCGGTFETAMPAACAVEMIHTYSLIHDDLQAMDDDDLRRGRASCHVEFDEATAILAGDALNTLAFEIIARDMKPAELAAQAVAELARAAGGLGMVGGQADDLRAEFAANDVDFLKSIHRRKTAALLTASLKIGAISANASEDQRSALEQYGQNVGLAFQIIDDLLDLRGEEIKIGKRTGKDSEHGKLTYPGVIGVDESEKLANDLASEAIHSLQCFGEPATPLKLFAKFVVNRTG